MDYKIGDMLAYYDDESKTLLDIVLVTNIECVYPKSAYAFTSYSTMPPDVYFSLDFNKIHSLTGVYKSLLPFDQSRRKLMALKEYQKIYG